MNRIKAIILEWKNFHQFLSNGSQLVQHFSDFHLLWNSKNQIQMSLNSLLPVCFLMEQLPQGIDFKQSL